MSKIEIEIGDEKRKIFMLIYKLDESFWIDFQGLPNSAFLCALIDGQEMIQSVVGEKDEEVRTFIDMEWAINDWGGDKEIVEALKKRKQMTLDDMPRLRKKYWSEE